MEFNILKGDIKKSYTGEVELVITLPKETNVEPLHDYLTNDSKEKVLTLDYKKRKRSINANNYFWKLCTEIADKLRTSKDEVHLSMLKQYGQSTLITVLDEAVPMLLKSVEHYEVVKEHCQLNGKLYTHIKVYMGSSSMNTLEMSILIDGTVSEAESLGICTLTPTEIQQLKSQWKIE